MLGQRGIDCRTKKKCWPIVGFVLAWTMLKPTRSHRCADIWSWQDLTARDPYIMTLRSDRIIILALDLVHVQMALNMITEIWAKYVYVKWFEIRLRSEDIDAHWMRFCFKCESYRSNDFEDIQSQKWVWSKRLKRLKSGVLKKTII